MDPYLLQSNISLYQQAPHYFSDLQVDQMETAAEQAGIKFKRNLDWHEQQIEKEAQQSSGILSQFGSGVFEGFLGPFAFGGWSDEPETESQAMAHSIGSLLGFVPGLAGGIFKGGATLAVKGLAMTGATATATKVLRASNRAYASFAKSPFATSIPLKAADKANAWTIGKLADAGYDVNKYLKSGNKTADIIKSAQHLGVASAVSSFWEGPSGIMQSYAHGLIAGGWFGTVGNFMNVGKMLHSANITKRLHAEDWIWNQVSKGMAGSMFQGGMSTFYGAPTATQVYEYLLGGYFGWKHPSAKVRIAREYIGEYKNEHPLRSEEFDMLKTDEFKALPKNSQEYIREHFKRVVGDMKSGIEEAAVGEGPGAPIAKMLADVLGEQKESILKKAEIKFGKGREELTDAEIFEIEADEIWKPMFELTENQLDVSRIAGSIVEGRTAELVGIDKEVYESLPKELREQIKSGDANAVEAMTMIAQEIQKDRASDKAAENITSIEQVDGEQNEVIRANYRIKDFLLELKNIAIQQEISELDVLNGAVKAYLKTKEAKEGYDDFIKRFWREYPTITPSEGQERFLKQLFRRFQTESFHRYYAWERNKDELHPVLIYNKEGKLVKNTKPDTPDELHFRTKLVEAVKRIGESVKGYTIELIRGVSELGPDSSKKTKIKVEKKEWSQYPEGRDNYEVSSVGDKRFSAFYAQLKDGRYIEDIYQLDIKGHGTAQPKPIGDKPTRTSQKKMGKFKREVTEEQSWAEYKELWRQYLKENPKLLRELRAKSKGKVLTDKFANTDVSQARALAEILNETAGVPKVSSKRVAFVKRLTKKMTKAIEKVAPKKWLEKEKVKTRIATQFIGKGKAGSSTEKYRIMYGEEGLSNTGLYDSTDVIYVSSNGKRVGRVNPVKNGALQGQYKNIDKAIDAGATIIMDTSQHLRNTGRYNIGELALARYIQKKGYRRIGETGVWEPERKPDTYKLKYGRTGRKHGKHRVGASVNHDKRIITLDKQRLIEMWKEKAWTKPKVKGVTPLDKNQFLTYEEWERFVLEHELAHTRSEQRKGETKAEYENRMNREALKELELSRGRGVEKDYKNKTIKVNQTILREKFNNKTWVDEGLEENLFRNYEEFELFEVEKELIRHRIRARKDDAPGDLERRIAKYASKSMGGDKFTFYKNQQIRDLKEVEAGNKVIKPYDNFYDWASRTFMEGMTPEAWRLVTHELDEQGYYPKIPKKDTGVERIFPYHPDTTKTKLSSIFKRILKKYPKSKIKILFKYDQEQYIKMMSPDFGKKLSKVVIDELKRMHEKAFISNYLYEKNYTFKGVSDRVKRETLFSDQEIPLNALDYINIAPKGELEIIFLDDKKAGGIKEYFRTEDGLILADSKTDGGMITHSNFFKTMVDVEGFRLSTSRLKPTAASWETDGSVFLLKAGIHPSRGGFDSAINPNQIIVFTSSAKSMPKGAKVHEGRVVKSKDGTVIGYRFKGVKKGDKPIGTKMKVGSLRLNYGVYEDAGSTKSQRIKKQFHSFLNSLQVSKKGFDSFMSETIDKAIAGDPVSNSFASEWIKDPTKIPSRKDFQIKDISYELVTKILNEHVDHPIYKELIADMMDQTRFLETEEMRGMEDEIIELREYTTRLQKWLKATDFHPIVPQLIENNLFQAMVLKYTTDKLTYPEWKYSGTGRVGAVDPLVEAIHGEIKNNSFKLGSSHSRMPVKWTTTGTDMRLEEAWDSYKKIRDGGRFKGRAKMLRTMEEDLRFALMRVPSPAVSGTRILMFDGFVRSDVGMEDFGVYTRSRDHFYFDGADVDMDGLYFYQGLPKEFKAEVFKNRHELEHKDSKGRWVMTKNKDPKYNKDYGSELNKFEKLIADKNVADPASQWLPWGLRQAGMSGYQGKDGMGMVINAKSFLNTVVADIIQNNDGELDLELVSGKKVWGKIKGTTNEKIINGSFRKHLVEASSRTADSANYFRIKNPHEVVTYLLKKAFPDIKMEVWDKKKKEYVEQPIEFRNLAHHSHYANLYQVNNLLYGKNWRQNRMHTLQEVQEGLRDITSQGDYMSSMWHIGKELSQYKIETNPMRFWSDKKAIDVWKESFKLFNEAFTKDKTLKDLLVRGGGLRVIPRYIVTKQEAKDRIEQYWEENPNAKKTRTVRWVHKGLRGLGKTPKERSEMKWMLPEKEQLLFNNLWSTSLIRRPKPAEEVIMRLNDSLDVWSAMNTARHGQKLLDGLKEVGLEKNFSDIAEELAVFADSIKNKYLHARGLNRKNNVPTYETMDQVNNIIKQKKLDIIEQAKGLGIKPELLEQYLYSRMLGTIWARRAGKDKVRKELEKHIKELEETPGENPEELRHYKEKLADFQKFYNKTSFHRFPIETDQIPNKVKNDFMSGFSGAFDLLKSGFENVADVKTLALERDRIAEVVKEREIIRNKEKIETEIDRDSEIREELMDFTDKPLDNIWDIKSRNLKKKDIPEDIPRVLEKIAEHFKGLPPAALYRINDIFAFMTAERDGVAMSVENMRWQDLRDLERFMGDIHRYGTKDKSPNALFYYLFPERAAQKMLTHDYTNVWKTPMPYVDAIGGKSMRSVDVPVGTMQLLNNSFGHIYTMENAVKQQWSSFRDEKYSIRNDILSMENGTAEWEKIHRVAVATMLRDSKANPTQRAFYEELYKENEKDYTSVKDKNYEITVEGEKRTITGEEVINKIHELHNEFFDMVYQKFVKSGIDFDLIDEKGIYTKQNEIMQWDSYGRLQIDSALQRILKPIVSGNMVSTKLIGRDGLTVEMLNRIQYEWALERIIEQEPSLRKKDGTINNDKAHRYRRRFRMDEHTKFNPIGFQKEYFPQMLHLETKEGRAKVRKWMDERTVELADYLENALRIRRSANDRSMIEKAGKDIDNRFEITENEFRELEKGNISEAKLIEQKMAQQERSFETFLGRRLNQDGGAGESASQWLNATFTNPTDLIASGFFSRPGSGRSRGPQPMPGFSMDFDVTSKYVDQWVSAFYRNATSLLAKKKIDDYVRRNSLNDEAATDQWANLMRMYSRDVMGYPTLFSKEMMALSKEERTEYERTVKHIKSLRGRRSTANKVKLAHAEQALKIDATKPKFEGVAGSVYYGLTDQFWIDKFDNMSRRFFNGKLPFYGELPKDPAARHKAITRVLHNMGSFEAKWTLITLLSHPKTLIGNALGGSHNTISRVGMRHWYNSRDLAYLTQNVFKGATLKDGTKIDSWDTIQRWVEEVGATENFIIQEAQLERAFTGKRAGTFLQDVLTMLKKDPNAPDASVYEVAKRHGLTQTFVDKAAWFMRSSERMLRRDAFLSHYLNAREIMQKIQPEYKFDNPFLLQFGLEGVKATQFLYHSAFRPPFSRTTVGKVMTRFHPFAWNSVRLRRETYAKARRYGFDKDSIPYKRLERLMVMDGMVFALANIFTASLFDSSMPPPMSWMQDTADWLFGDPNDREKAFFNQYPHPALAPLSVITPPSGRYPLNLINGMINGNWERFADYQVFTWFPFGRIARSTLKTVETPEMILEQFTGFPIHGIGRRMRKGREEDE